MHYPTYVDLECPHCCNLVLIKRVTMFGDKTCEIEFGGAPTIICNFCGGVVGILKPCNSNEKDEEEIFYPLFET